MSLKPIPRQRSSVITTKTVPWSLHECKKTYVLEFLELYMSTWKDTKISLQHHLNPQRSIFQVWWAQSCQIVVGFYLQDLPDPGGCPGSCSVSLKPLEGARFLLINCYSELRQTDHLGFGLRLPNQYQMVSPSKCHLRSSIMTQMTPNFITLDLLLIETLP